MEYSVLQHYTTDTIKFVSNPNRVKYDIISPVIEIKTEKHNKTKSNKSIKGKETHFKPKRYYIEKHRRENSEDNLVNKKNTIVREKSKIRIDWIEEEKNEYTYTVWDKKLRKNLGLTPWDNDKHQKREYKCPFCTLITNQKKTLNKHMKVIHKCENDSVMTSQEKLKSPFTRIEKKDEYVCPYCNFKTIRTDNLKKHMKKVHKITGEIVFFKRCPYCPFNTNITQTLKSHILKLHYRRGLLMNTKNYFIQLPEYKHIENPEINIIESI